MHAKGADCTSGVSLFFGPSRRRRLRFHRANAPKGQGAEIFVGPEHAEAVFLKRPMSQELSDQGLRKFCGFGLDKAPTLSPAIETRKPLASG
jgi:hypothetical protein